MSKSKLLPFVVIGAVVGATISMFDKTTRQHTVETSKKVKGTVTYYAENREELMEIVGGKVQQAQNLYSTVNNNVQNLLQGQDPNELKTLPGTIQGLVSETIQAFSKKDNQQS
ncbi:YtxH domain-containing protein [Solibacillus sp. FSL K6-1523]|uniref:YtxH domain-containing protein n=1 Tax=Solibacillus sp. FSL K6-1523 TaxID=2921471 RepID=UPI0030FB5271